MGEKEDSSKLAAGAVGRPTITLPAKPYGESFFNGGGGGGFGFSPGPMTLVSNFFSDSEDCKSFSQLLAGAMVSPAAAAAAVQERPEGSGGVNSAAEVDTRFKQNRPAGLVVTPPPPAAAFTVPPGLSPAMLLDSPSFLGLFSPAQGNFLMSHQQALAQVTAHAVQSNNAQIQILPQYSSSEQHEHLRITESPTKEFYPSEQHRTQQQTVDKPADDGYNWRKYGQKHVKGSEYPRSYYKCTSPGCTVKKKVERSLDGQVTEIIYKGQHNHQPPQNNKRGKDGRNLNGNLMNNVGNSDSGSGFQFQKVKNDNETSLATTEQISEASDSEEVGDAETGMRVKDDDEPDAKRRSTEIRVSEAASSSSHRTVSEPRIIVQTTSEVDLLDDGYRWRKYGQKVVKGNPYPRSYYKCTTQGCNVRKHVERAPTDPKAVITTYEGKHNHDLPAARAGSHAAAAANPQLRHDGLNASSIPQQPIARLRLKEEQTT